MTLSPIAPPHIHNTRFFFPDGTVIFLVGSMLYKVHRYFFQRDSSIFDAMFSLPPPEGKRPEGEDENNPIVLVGVEPQDFDRLLAIFYPCDFVEPELRTIEEWISILNLSTRWDFTSLRELSITRISQVLDDPSDLIVLGIQYNVTSWLVSAYTEICERKEPLTLEEGRKVGVDLCVMIAQARHKIRYNSNLNRDHDTIVQVIRHIFNLK
ncbi:hypothetical protein E1B28_010345 [Marasmius oreades]|uniref:BTB domain-containing protein n=1 Tax=Marasmius oreades TaxID=181124 RepID=A0A9P7RWU4_9AGAR|nr:uncharacterized protein E1B28_010345 [Marasmius oreades]KAG7091299.1 hypothetical protein E1B28_010345 [Marasmius oreades]